jgi:alanine racemase
MRKITVDLDVIASNYKILKKLSGTKVMAIVKADAFGHGIVEVSKKLDSINVDMLGTADLEEAMVVRSAGVKAPLVAWLHGQDADFERALENDIQIGIATLVGLEKVAEASKSTGVSAKLHLKVDTGLGRNGAALADWPALIAAAVELRNAGLVELVGVFSHLSGTTEKDDLKQLEVFNAAVAEAEALGASFEMKHLAASLATLSYASTSLDMVRVGIALYGLDPNEGTRAADFGLLPAMKVSSEVVQVKRVPKGHGVSYGYLYKTKNEANLALVPFGYADGLPRIATGKAEVLLNGKKYKILARVAMDQFVLDIGDDTAALGDEVVIFGDAAKGEPTAMDLARASESIPYEIVTRLGSRVKRVFL